MDRVQGKEDEKLSGIVERVTYHNEENGWSVLKVRVYGKSDLQTVTVHQTKAFPGATMEFYGSWTNHARFGQQFKAERALEKKPATIGALEKYIGSGLIYGVGPAIAKRIVNHFASNTLDIFENDIDRLEEVAGISKRKLIKIKETWREHRAIRDVMIFLQDHNISTLYAVKIYKKYGDEAISIVSNNPYRLATDIYGIGFKSADKVALSMGYGKESDERLMAAILHILAAARDEGHCFLTTEQISQETVTLLAANFKDRVPNLLNTLENSRELMVRIKKGEAIGEDGSQNQRCYYNRGLWFDEDQVANTIKQLLKVTRIYQNDIIYSMIADIEESEPFPLSSDQRDAVAGLIGKGLGILTGGPGCGKTTTLNILVKLLKALDKKILLAAPTGRAAQRMGEVIGQKAHTIHRLLKFNPRDGKFSFNRENPLKTDVLIVDETSMLDITLTAALMNSLQPGTQLLFIGDSDQLPSVGAGNVLKDMIESEKVPTFRLSTIFRQAEESLIIKYAHAMNQGKLPLIETPFRNASLWRERCDCMFIDSDEATVDQSRFISRSKSILKKLQSDEKQGVVIEHKSEGDESYKSIEVQNRKTVTNNLTEEAATELMGSEETISLSIPQKFLHVDPQELLNSPTYAEELKSVLKRIHPYSTLRYGFTSTQIIVHLYRETIKRYFGEDKEIQILSPMTKGTLGTLNLNKLIQREINPATIQTKELQLGEKIFREGDRVIQRRNNYDLEVFNGDIGKITDVDMASMGLTVQYKGGEENRTIIYDKVALLDLDLAYAITIHKSQGSEFDAVILPIAPQHYNMLFRNLIYTGLTRSKKLTLFVGNRYSLKRAIDNEDNRKRQTMLKELLH